jgi:hypothetical protein
LALDEIAQAEDSQREKVTRTSLSLLRECCVLRAACCVLLCVWLRNEALAAH